MVKKDTKELHLLTHCPFSNFKCDECSQIYNLKELNNHICFSHLKNEITQLKREKTKLELDLNSHIT